MSSSRSCWSCYWLLRVQLLADRSTCSTRSVGAVAVLDKRAVCDGFNGTLAGYKHCDQGGCPRCAKGSGLSLETCVCCHAEANLVANAARLGATLMHTTVYCTTQPCMGCTKLLAGAGVDAVIYDEKYPAAPWELQNELTLAALLDDPNGVAFSRFKCTCS